jgi:hypothetical protein
MRRSVLLSVLAGLVLLAAGCASDESAPGTMEPSAEPSTEAVPDQGAELRLRCRDNGLIILQLAAILSPKPPERLLQKAITQFSLIELSLLLRKKSQAQARAIGLIEFLIDNRHKLINPTSPTTQVRLGNVIDAILCVVGLDPTGVTLDQNTGIGIVPANNPDPVVITTPQGNAGVLVPENRAPNRDEQGNPIAAIVVTVTALGNSSPLNTRLDQYGQTIELTASQDVLWREGGVAVAICVSAEDTLFQRLRLGHEGEDVEPEFDSIEILPPASDSAVEAVVGVCGPIGARSPFGRLGDFAKRVLLPAPLHAAAFAARTGGVGGTTRKFSKFGAVDPLLFVDKRPTSTDGTAGAPVAQPPSVRVHTEQSTDISGIGVQFQVPAGSPGSIVPGLVTTGSDGVAATTTWTLGLGENRVVATPVSPASDIIFFPTTQTFIATGTANPIEYRSGGYRFIRIGAVPPSGSTGDYPGSQWFLPGFAPGTAWGTGGAPFGEAGASCSIFGTSPVTTVWEASDVEGQQAVPTTGTGILVRRTFTTPVGFSGEVLINVAVDNDIQVYVDGTDVTNRSGVTFIARTNDDAVDGSWSGYIAPFRPHSGCARQNDGTFEVPASLLAAGTTHTIAVYAHDWGGASYLDLEVRLEP